MSEYPNKLNDKENVKTSPAQQQEKSEKYQCKVCSYVYDSEKGDPDNGINPGTLFEDLPNDWKCPECGVNKDQFEEIKA